MTRLLLLVALAGCRIGFDARMETDAGADDARVPIAPTFVQTESTGNPGSTTATIALPNSVVAGNMIMVAIDYGPTTTITLVSVTDDQGNTYTPIGPIDGGLNQVRHYLAWTIAATAGRTTVTSTVSGAPSNYYDLRLHEYANTALTDPIEATANATGTATGVDQAISAPVTTTEPNELLFGYVTFQGTGLGGSDFTVRSTFDGDITEDRIAAVPGTYRATGTPMGASWTAIVAAIRGR